MRGQRSEVEQRVLNTFPHPVSAGWLAVVRAGSLKEQAQPLLHAYNIVLRTLLAWWLPDYLRGPTDPTVEKLLPTIKQPADGDLAQLVDHVARVLGGRPACFFPELRGWMGPESPRRHLPALAPLRNKHAHHRADIEENAAQLRAALVQLLDELSWICRYRMVAEVRSTAVATGRRRAVLDSFVGFVEYTPPMEVELGGEAFIERHVYLVAPSGDVCLDLWPFFGLHRVAGADHICLFEGQGKGGGLAVKCDAVSAKETRSAHPTLDGASVSFEQLLQRRAEYAPELRVFDHRGQLVLGGEGTGGQSILQKNWELVAPLGEGGSASVFRVRDRSSKRDYAMKVLHRHLMGTEQEQRFIEEDATLGRLLDKPRVILREVAPTALPDGRPYILLRYLAGGTLADKVPPAGEPHNALGRVLGWAVQMAEALATVHEAEVVHRDVKPSNFLLDDAGEVWISDFGLALRDDRPAITQHQHRLGSPEYLPPEVAREGHSPASDVFSLGMSIQELVIGRLVAGASAEVPEPLAGLLRRMLAPEARERPSARAAAEALRSMTVKPAEAARRAGPPPPPRPNAAPPPAPLPRAALPAAPPRATPPAPPRASPAPTPVTPVLVDSGRAPPVTERRVRELQAVVTAREFVQRRNQEYRAAGRSKSGLVRQLLVFGLVLVAGAGLAVTFAVREGAGEQIVKRLGGKCGERHTGSVVQLLCPGDKD